MSFKNIKSLTDPKIFNSSMSIYIVYIIEIVSCVRGEDKKICI